MHFDYPIFFPINAILFNKKLNLLSSYCNFSNLLQFLKFFKIKALCYSQKV